MERFNQQHHASNHQPGSPALRSMCLFAACLAAGLSVSVASAQSNTDNAQAEKHTAQEQRVDRLPSDSLDGATQNASSESGGAIPRPDFSAPKADELSIHQAAPDIGQQDPAGDSAEALERNSSRAIPDWSQALQPFALFNPSIGALMNPWSVVPRYEPQPDPGPYAR